MRGWAILLTVLLCAGPLQAREPVRIQSKWADLSAKVIHKKVGFTTSEGTSIEGKVIAVEADGLRMEVSKTSDRKRQPKGLHLIARQSIKALRITEHRGFGRVGLGLGLAAAAGGIVAAQRIDTYEGPAVVLVPALIAAGTIGAGIAGYFVGKKIDERVTDIEIVP